MAPAHRRSLTSRAVVTVLLWVGFWLLAATLVGLLGWIPLAQLEHQRGIDFAGVAAGAGAVVLLWTLRPRWWFAKKPSDGRPGLSREDFPALHRFVAEVAGRCGAPPADEIQLADLATAYIRADRRRFWQHKRRVVGIGLPLFTFLSRTELAAVLAHEFGHQRGGDLLLSPWVRRSHLQRRLSDWLALALHLRGFDAELWPGRTLTLRKGEVVVRPRTLVNQLVSGEVTSEEYLKLCARWAAGPV